MNNLVGSAKSAQEKVTVLGSEKKVTEKILPSKIMLVKPEPKNLPKEEKKKKEEAKVEEEPKQVTQKMPISIEKLADKAERLFLLKQKYQEVKDKRKQVDNFAISHDNNNAQLTLVDANGMSIKTSNPASIKKLLDDWVIDLDAHLSRVEKEMRQELAEA